MKIFDALKLAQEAELDLVEVSPNTNPPVCKITDYGQFQYNASKKQKSNKPKKIETKCIRLTFKIGKHDLDVRGKQAQKFIKQGDRVRLEMMLRGREREHKDIAFKIVDEFINNLVDIVKVEQAPKFQEGKVSAIIKGK